MPRLSLFVPPQCTSGAHLCNLDILDVELHGRTEDSENPQAKESLDSRKVSRFVRVVIYLTLLLYQ